MAEHTCDLPKPKKFYRWADEHEDWRVHYWQCPDCTQTWYINGPDYCRECGHLESKARWTKVADRFIGPQLPAHMIDTVSMFAFPLVSVRRGGIRFGEPAPEPEPEPVFYDPSYVLNRGESRTPKGATPLPEPLTLTAQGGWCAPSETLYREF